MLRTSFARRVSFLTVSLDISFPRTLPETRTVTFPRNVTSPEHMLYSTFMVYGIPLGSVGFRTETVETITEEVGPERESNLRPPARDSLKHGFADMHMVQAA